MHTRVAHEKFTMVQINCINEGAVVAVGKIIYLSLTSYCTQAFSYYEFIAKESNTTIFRLRKACRTIQQESWLSLRI